MNRNRNPSFSHCRFNLLRDANSMAQPAQIERCNKGMADSLSNGHGSPRRFWSASCSPYCSLGMRWKKAQPDAGLPTKTYCNRGAVSIDLENLFETAPAFGACFIALFLFQRWSIQTPLLALFRAAIHWLSSLSCIYAINIHITENRKPHRTNMGCLFNDFNYAAGYFAPNNILRCIMI